MTEIRPIHHDALQVINKTVFEKQVLLNRSSEICSSNSTYMFHTNKNTTYLHITCISCTERKSI